MHIHTRICMLTHDQALFDRVVVCPEAYRVFVTEKNLQDQEMLFARSLINKSLPAISER